MADATITLRHVTDSYKHGSRRLRERTYKYTSIEWAVIRARRLVGSTPKIDPDGYAVNRGNGSCLFFIGITKEQLFPELAAKK